MYKTAKKYKTLACRGRLCYTLRHSNGKQQERSCFVQNAVLHKRGLLDAIPWMKPSQIAKRRNHS